MVCRPLQYDQRHFASFEIGQMAGVVCHQETCTVFESATTDPEVVYEIAKLIRKDTREQPMPYSVLSGVMTGMVVLWATGLVIK